MFNANTSLFSHFLQIILLASIAIVSSLIWGSTQIDLYDAVFVNNTLAHHILFSLRMPHTIHAFVTGGLLALAGMLVQLLTRNPIADPYLLGISSGAAFFLLIFMLMGCSLLLLPVGAWLGSVLTVALLYFLTKKHEFHPHYLILNGVALASLFATGIGALLVFTNATRLQSTFFWLMGDLSFTQYNVFSTFVLVAVFCICMLLSPALNMLTRGVQTAKILGLNHARYQFIIFILSSICTATVVTTSGCIGFVGLIIPHMTRYFYQDNYGYNLIFAILLGGTFLTFADLLARIVLPTQALPVGMVSALLGLPIFLWLLYAKQSYVLS